MRNVPLVGLLPVRAFFGAAAELLFRLQNNRALGIETWRLLCGASLFVEFMPSVFPGRSRFFSLFPEFLVAPVWVIWPENGKSLIVFVWSLLLEQNSEQLDTLMWNNRRLFCQLAFCSRFSWQTACFYGVLGEPSEWHNVGTPNESNNYDVGSNSVSVLIDHFWPVLPSTTVFST